ncbi:MAG TPA: ATP-binding cassette domain-containing protein [Gemmataceae bacterium]|jgi:phospholipid/cholesterol/gamma-HCH transport system ATP-binding protein|nr:ATP-binding cassette domain-containing protein [Gemmataceae bacterium]
MTPPAPEKLLELERVAMQFGAQLVLRDLSLDVRRGETLCVIGESGCGKTVLLKLLVGLLQPSSGRVLLDNRDLHNLSAVELTAARRRFGFVFQGAALFDSLSVYENVAYPLRTLHDLKETAIAERVHARLAEVGLPTNAAAKMPAELSGGMRKRVGLARALALDPEVMLYDEPTTGLDPVMTELINDLIRQTRERRPITSIVVTHEMKTVVRVADRVAMLYPLARLADGQAQLIFDGPVDGLMKSADERVQTFVQARASIAADGNARQERTA